MMEKDRKKRPGRRVTVRFRKLLGSICTPGNPRKRPCRGERLGPRESFRRPTCGADHPFLVLQLMPPCRCQLKWEISNRSESVQGQLANSGVKNCRIVRCDRKDVLKTGPPFRAWLQGQDIVALENENRTSRDFLVVQLGHFERFIVF